MDGFLANIKQRRERNPSICINCGVKPRDEGFQYCSKDCAREAQAKLLGKMPIAPPPPAPPPPADDEDWEDEGEVLSDPNLCEQCHQKPKYYDRSKGILYQTCGRRCRDEFARKEAQPHCKLRGCNKTFNTNDEYCSQEHAQEAVKKGEAKGCPVCLVNPITHGFKHCSRECAIKQSSQPKLNGPARSGSSNAIVPSFPPPTNHGPDQGVDKETDAPTIASSNTSLCEHCGIWPRSAKTSQYCSKECAKAARIGRKPSRWGNGADDESDEDWPAEPSSTGRTPQRHFDGDEDRAWGNVQEPLPSQPPVIPANTKTYSCCNCTITTPSGPPPAECPICKLAEVRKELEAEKNKIRIPPPPPIQPPSWAPIQQPHNPPPAPVPAPAPAPAPAPQPKPVQPSSFARPAPPVQAPMARKITPPVPIKPAGPKPQVKQPAPAPQRRQLDEEEDEEEDEDFFVRTPEPAPKTNSQPVTVDSDDEDDDSFLVRRD